jgi:hypothetical protein
MRTTILSLGLGLLLATPAFAKVGDAASTTPTKTKLHSVHKKIAEGDKPTGDKPVEGAKPVEGKKTTKKTTKKVEKKGEEKPVEAAPAK